MSRNSRKAEYIGLILLQTEKYYKQKQKLAPWFSSKNATTFRDAPSPTGLYNCSRKNWSI